MGKKEAKPWTGELSRLYADLESSEKGLSSEEARKRLEVYGKNELPGKEKRTALRIFLSQFKSAFLIVLLFAAIVSFFFHQRIEAIVILAMIVINVLMGFIQEYRAERTIKALEEYVSVKAKVLRNKEIIEIDSKKLVPGDVVYLDIGDMVPADIRLMATDSMSADEAALTGESMPVSKIMQGNYEKCSIPQDIKNMVFMGTSIASGYGHGIVVSTGKETFFGKISTFAEEQDKGDFQINMNKFSSMLLKVIILMTLFIFIVNGILGKGILTSLLFALALAVGITPELLPVILTVSLSKGAIKMAKEKVVIKKLMSIEDLGNIDILCCDKTGTLTEGKLSLMNYLNMNEKKEKRLLLYSMLCNSGTGARGTDNPLDKAVWLSKEAELIRPEYEKYEILDKNEFDFERRRMSVLVSNKGIKKLIIKGAPESIMGISAFMEMDGEKVRLSKNHIADIREKVENYEKNGYRVVLIAERDLVKNGSSEKDEKDLSLLGFLLFLDPPKKTVREALDKFKKLNVDVKILSGDSPIITKKICEEVGLHINGRVINGEELKKLSEKRFGECCKKYNVFARIDPEQKHRIVAFLSKSHVVGFLGDGINDVPALKAANVGISVESGTGIAKDAADIILLQKSLLVLAHGIIEGRKTFVNINKYILNTISANYGNMFTVAASSLFMKFIPLLPSQILLNNFVSDVPNLAISSDKVDDELLKKPKKWNLNLIYKFMIYFGILSSFFDLLLISTMLLMRTNAEVFRTAWFTESLLSEVLIVFAIRTSRPFFRSKPSNWLVFISIVSAIIGVLITYAVIGKKFFDFAAMPLWILGLIAGILIAYFVSAEFLKKFFFRKFSE
jgi:Mg2+-importing ATPase